MRALSFDEKFLRLNIGEWASDDFDVDMNGVSLLRRQTPRAHLKDYEDDPPEPTATCPENCHCLLPLAAALP